MSRVSPEIPRKVVHVGMGGLAFLLRWLTPFQAASCAAAALLLNWFVLHPLTRRRLLRAGESERSFSSGIVLYPAAVLALVLLFHERLEIAAAVWGLMAFGDGMATVAGLTFGGARLPWNRQKTWAGTVAFVVFGASASSLLLVWVGGAGASTPAPLLAGCIAASFAAALVESLPTGIDDNISVPLTGGLILSAATLVDPFLLARSVGSMGPSALRGFAVNAVLAVGAYLARSVSVSGAVIGTLLGTLLFAFSGWRGFALLFAFFVLGTVATRMGWRRKAALGIAQEKEGRRGAKHAFANTSAGIVFALLSQAHPDTRIFLLAMAAAFATAAADTVASEIGQAYGRRAYLITTLRRVPPGTDGAISLEGTLAGVLASVLVAAIAWGSGLISAGGVPLVTIAAFVGTTLESYAAVTRRIDNEIANFGNTLAGGLAAIALQRLFPG